MKSSARALLALVVFGVIAIGLLTWSVQQTRAKAEALNKQILSKLDEKDLNLILTSQMQGNPQQLAALKDNPEARKEITEQLKSLLALAAESRRQGFADNPTTKSQLSLSEKVLVAQNYDKKQTKGQPAPPFGSVTKDETDAFWNNPDHKTEFKKVIDAEIAAIKAAGQPAPKFEGETLKRVEDQYARIMITYDKAKADSEFMSDRSLQLNIGFQQARVLASEYAAKRLAKESEPTKEEIAAYLAEHPEKDAKKQREKAADILRRAQAGEDFAKLANEFSEDPGNKDPQTNEAKGGLYEDVAQGSFVPEFETAALGVEKGQVVPTLVETQYGYHIIKLEDKKVEKSADGKENVTFSARHILLQNKFPGPSTNPMARPQLLSGEDIARAELGEKKQKKLIEELIARNKIELPEDFNVEVPEGADGRQPLPQQPNLPAEMHSDDDGHNHAPAKK